MKNWGKLFLLVVFALVAAKIAMADQNFKVTGIMMGDKPIAIVNGQTVVMGDQVDGAEVEAITNDSVSLKYQGSIIVSKIVQNVQSVQQVSAEPAAEDKDTPSKEDANPSSDEATSEEETSKSGADDSSVSDSSSVYSSDVKDVDIVLYEEAGSIEGYITFYNDEGKECTVKTSGAFDSEAVLYTGSKLFQKNKISIDITESGFEEIPLRGGGSVLGFPIDKFHVPGEWRMLGFIFEWNGFKKRVAVTNED